MQTNFIPPHRRDYISRSQYNTNDSCDNLIFDLLNNAIRRSGLPIYQQSTLKRKNKGDLKIIKVLNNLLRNTVVLTYHHSFLNKEKTVEAFFKRYRKNTVDKFGQPRRVTQTAVYNLLDIKDTYRLVEDVEKHMAILPENLKTINDQLNVRISDFTEITRDSLFAFEIYGFEIKPSEKPLDGYIELSLVSNKMEKDLTIKISDIINFNNISELIGKWIVINYKGAFKIKTKDEIFNSYNILETQ